MHDAVFSLASQTNSDMAGFAFSTRWRRVATVDEAVRIVESTRMLNRKMFQELFKDAQILTERFFWLPKSFIAVNVGQTREKSRIESVIVRT